MIQGTHCFALQIGGTGRVKRSYCYMISKELEWLSAHPTSPGILKASCKSRGTVRENNNNIPAKYAELLTWLQTPSNSKGCVKKVIEMAIKAVTF